MTETEKAQRRYALAISGGVCEVCGAPLSDGHIWPKGESECSTDECAKLIEAAHVLAADLGIILQE